MTNRLYAIASQINNGAGTVDVGTDHGHIPIYLAQSGYTGNIIASDINSGPLAAAKRAAEEAGVSQRIEFTLCNGLDGCPPEAVDTIVIAGMGGELICELLDRAEWCMSPRYRLVLQPMTKAEILRYWLINNEFSITRELLAEDSGTVYQIITAEFAPGVKLSDGELFTGEFAKVHAQALFPKRLNSLISRFQHMLDGMRSSATSNAGRERLYGEILRQLMEMRENDHK